MTKKAKKKIYIPSSFLVIILMMLVFIVASWIGNLIDSDKITGIGILDVFTAIWHGLKSKVDIIIFVFSIGGTLAVMARIKAIDAGISALVKKLGTKFWLLIPTLMFIFGLGGTSYGMWEDTLVFIPILIPVFKKAGYGSFTAILVILVGAGVGCLASTINPFAVGTATNAVVGTKEMPGPYPKMTNSVMQGTRWISFILFEILASILVFWLASRYRDAISKNLKTDLEAKQTRNGQNSFVFFFKRPRVIEGLEEAMIEKRFNSEGNFKFTTKRKISLALFITCFILMILMYLPWGQFLSDSNGIDNYRKWMYWFASVNDKSGYAQLGEWWFISISGVFLMITLIIFAINLHEFRNEDQNAEQGFIKTYLDGIKDMVGVSMLIAVAAGLGQILKATQYGNLIARESAKGLTNLVAFGVVVFLVSIFLSLLIPSTLGFAGAFMAIFAEIAVIAFPENVETAIGISILGFIFANGLANFVTPTSAALMGYTQYAGVPYYVWLKQTWKITFSLFLLALFLIILFSGIASSGSNLF